MGAAWAFGAPAHMKVIPIIAVITIDKKIFFFIWTSSLLRSGTKNLAKLYANWLPFFTSFPLSCSGFYVIKKIGVLFEIAHRMIMIKRDDCQEK
jgi:hypothetical protein